MKLDKKIELGRNQGMAYALEVLKSANSPEEGLKKLEDDIKRRGVRFIPLEIPLNKFDEFEDRVRCNTMETVTIMAMNVLHDEFGFGHSRLKRYMDRFAFKTECLQDRYISWDELHDILLEECGISPKFSASLRKELREMNKAG